MTAYTAGETARIVVSITDNDEDKPQVPTPATVTLTVKDIEEVANVTGTWPAALTIIQEDKGVTTAADANGVTDSTQAWVVDQWRDYVLRIVDGAAIGQERRIKSNTATALVIDPKVKVNGLLSGPFTASPGVGANYIIHRSTYFCLWDIPVTLLDVDVKVIVTATGTSPAYKAVRKEDVRIEGLAA